MYQEILDALNSAQAFYLRVVKEVLDFSCQAVLPRFQVTERNQGLSISYLLLNHESIVPYTFSK